MLQVIRDKIKAGIYDNKFEYPRKNETMKEGYITDEDKSVKWNREQVQNNITEYHNKIDAYHQEGNRVYALFEQDVINYIKKVYNFKEEAIKFLLGEAWEEGHSVGLDSVIVKLEDLIELVIDFNERNK